MCKTRSLAFDTCQRRLRHAYRRNRAGQRHGRALLPPSRATTSRFMASSPRARRYGDRVALVDGPTGQEVTYALLAERVERVSALLAERGFGPGDVLALQAPNVPWGRALAAMAAGGAVTGVLPASTPARSRGEPRTPARRCWSRRRIRPTGDRHDRDRRRPARRSRAGAAPGCGPGRARPAAVFERHQGCRRASRSRTATSSPACARRPPACDLTEDDVVLALAPFAHVMGSWSRWERRWRPARAW